MSTDDEQERKRRKYFAQTGFRDGMPFGVMIQVLSNLSDVGILDLHGLSKDIQNKQLRRAAEIVIKQRVRAKLDRPLEDIESQFAEVNYRHLLIAIMVYDNATGDDRTITFRSMTNTSDFFGYVIKGRGHRGMTQVAGPTRVKVLMELISNNLIISNFHINPRGIITPIQPVDNISLELFEVLILYVGLTIEPGYYIVRQNSFPPNARIRCSICDTPAKLECKECETYFCSEECHA